MELPALDRMVETYLPLRDPSPALLVRMREEFVRDSPMGEFKAPDAALDLCYKTKPVPWEKYLFGQAYFATLRNHADPLLRQLLSKGMINWYSFLLHPAPRVEPAMPPDTHAYIHLRMAVSPNVEIDDLLDALPPDNRWKGIIGKQNLTRFDKVKIESLRPEGIRLVWQDLGESSERLLKLLDAHKPDYPIPVQSLRQLLHYTGNQFVVTVFGIPML